MDVARPHFNRAIEHFIDQAHNLRFPRQGFQGFDIVAIILTAAVVVFVTAIIGIRDQVFELAAPDQQVFRIDAPDLMEEAVVLFDGIRIRHKNRQSSSLFAIRQTAPEVEIVDRYFRPWSNFFQFIIFRNPPGGRCGIGVQKLDFREYSGAAELPVGFTPSQRRDFLRIAGVKGSQLFFDSIPSFRHTYSFPAGASPACGTDGAVADSCLTCRYCRFSNCSIS